MRDAKPRPGADRIKVAINVFLIALLTRRVFLLDWPDMEPFFHSPYFDWRYGPFNRTLERCVLYGTDSLELRRGSSLAKCVRKFVPILPPCQPRSLGLV